ncbi:cyclic lactone autoinducer peptide [Hungatella sp.]|nr:cyclic lactone autoinducer peptide [Hungatella sp.]
MIILSVLARIAEFFARSGAGLASWGTDYQPEIPEELK